MILLNYYQIQWRWLPELYRLPGWFLDIRWLGFQFCIYSSEAADHIQEVFNNHG